jgi:hypothetical protein
LVRWSSFAVTGFWALYDNIFEYVLKPLACYEHLLLRDFDNRYGNAAKEHFLYAALSKKCTEASVCSSMTCHVHVLPYNAAKHIV